VCKCCRMQNKILPQPILTSILTLECWTSNFREIYFMFLTDVLIFPMIFVVFKK
jgi:hypothetical protein